MIAVDRDGHANPECVRVKKGNTTLVWQGGADVRYLMVRFQPGQTNTPEDPCCSGTKCTLEKAKHATKDGDFLYDVEVVRTNGSEALEDPRLIIDP